MSKKIKLSLNQTARFLLKALIVLIPIIFLLNFTTVFTAPKLLILRFISMLVFLIYIFEFLFKPNFDFKFPKKAWAFLPWLTSLLLSTIFSLNILTSIYGQFGRYVGLITILNFLILPFFYWHYFTKEDIQELMKISVFTAVFVSIFGLLQYFNLLPLKVAWTDSPQNRIFSTVGHANHLGAWLAMNIFFLLIPFSRAKLSTRFSTSLRAGIFILFFFTLILTASRAALFSFLASVLIIFLLKQKFTKSFLPKGNLLKPLIIVSILILSIFLAPNLIERTQQTFQSIQKGYLPDRISFALSSLEMFRDFPILGTGLSTFRDAYSSYRRLDYFIDGPGNAMYITVPEAAHNEYLNTLATQGVVGFLTYIFLITVFLKMIFDFLKKSDSHSEKRLGYALFGAILVYLIQTFFNFAEIVNLFAFYFLLSLIGLLSTEQNSLKPKLQFFQKIFFAILTLLVLGWFFIYFVIAFTSTEINLKYSKVAQATGQLNAAQSFLTEAINNSPHEYSVYQSLADFQLKAAFQTNSQSMHQEFLDQAIKNYQSSIALNSNYPSTFYNLSLAYFDYFDLTKEQGQADLGLKALEIAVQKARNNPRYLYEYARKLHAYFNQREKAVEILIQASKMNPAYQEPTDYLNFLYQNHPELKK